MSKLTEAWLGYLVHNKGRSKSTATKYRGYLERLEEWAGDRDLLDITRQDLEQFTGIVMHQAGLSPRSRRALVAAVRGFFAYLEREGVLPASPADDLDYPKAGKKIPAVISLKNAERMLMECDLSEFKGVRDAAILAVLIGGGVRVSGLCGLNESDLLWTRDHKDRELLILRITEKGNKQRLVPMPAESRYLIRAYLGHVDLAMIDRSLPDGDQVLFVSLRNRTISADQYHGEARRISPRSINDLLDEYGERTGVPKEQRHPHAFRHRYGTELVEDEVPDIIGQSLLGHVDPKSYQVYTQLAMRKLVDVVERSNPMKKIRTVVDDLVPKLEKSQR